MTESGPLAHLWILGPGRLGLALGSALARAPEVGALTVLGRRTEPPDHPLFAGPSPRATFQTLAEAAGETPTAILITVPDRAVSSVADTLAEQSPPVPVLHTCGALGLEALEPLARLGFPVGSIHPLVAVAAPASGAERLIGAWYGVEAAGAAATFADALLAALGGRALRIGRDGKALYHTAAVFASNYVVGLLAVAERLMDEAGVGGPNARSALTALARGAVDNVRERGPSAGLTGPVSRGDVETIERHLTRLSPEDRRLYSVLACEALVLARRAGLEPAAAARVARLLEEEMP